MDKSTDILSRFSFGKLTPCRRCGNQAFVHAHKHVHKHTGGSFVLDEDGNEWFTAECATEGCIKLGPFQTPEGAAKEWNAAFRIEHEFDKERKAKLVEQEEFAKTQEWRDLQRMNAKRAELARLSAQADALSMLNDAINRYLSHYRSDSVLDGDLVDMNKRINSVAVALLDQVEKLEDEVGQ